MYDWGMAEDKKEIKDPAPKLPSPFKPLKGGYPPDPFKKLKKAGKWPL